MPLEAGQLITVELSDARLLVVGEELCMGELALDDPDNKKGRDEAVEIPEGLMDVLKFDIKGLRLKAVLEVILNIGEELLDKLDMVLDADNMLLSVEVVDIIEEGSVRGAEGILELRLFEAGITCAPQTFVFKLAAPTELFR